MKSKEDLIKDHFGEDANYSYDVKHGFILGVKYAFQSIVERIDTYEKYKISYSNDTSKIELFKKDHPEVIFDFKEHSWWNDWLFHYCFDGVK